MGPQHLDPPVHDCFYGSFYLTRSLMFMVHKVEGIVAAGSNNWIYVAALFCEELASLVNLKFKSNLGINEYTSLCNSFEWPRTFIRE